MATKQEPNSPKPKNKLAVLKEQQAAAFIFVKNEFSDKLTGLVDYVECLDENEIRQIVSDPAIEHHLAALGLELKKGIASPANATKPSAVKRGRRSKVKDEDIIKYLKTEHSVGEIREQYLF